MSFCEHCQGQRFDRAQVLRALRAARRRLGASRQDRLADQTLASAIASIRALEIPHLEPFDTPEEGEVVH